MSRKALLEDWLNNILGTTEYTCLPLAGDASFRKYYRVQLGHISYVLMDAPPPETPSVFVTVAALLQAYSIAVPNITAFDEANGFVLLSDFGDRLYSHALNVQSAPILYQEAIEALLKMQQCQGPLPSFNKAFMIKQLGVFKEWYLEKHLQMILDTENLQTLDALSDALFNVIAEQPSVFVHQDYHSRNLMILDEGGPGILDFQDALIGPITYDLVSLFQDAYITWPRSQVEDWVKEYQIKAQTLGILSDKITPSEFLRWMDLTGLQRHLKNLGIFARLNYRDGKKQYLSDMPRLKGYIKETADRYLELNPYKTFFENVLSKQEKNTCAPLF